MKKIKYLFFILLFFISISSVNAEETKTGIGYLNNSTVIISDNRGNDIQLSSLTTNSQDITIRNIIFQSNYNFQKDIVYEYEIELANQYIDNISSIFLRGGNTICSFISLQGLNNSYLKIRFTCPSNVSYVTIGLSNLGGSAITDGYDIQWKNIYLWQINDVIDLGPIINGQNQNTQDIINNQNNLLGNKCSNEYNGNITSSNQSLGTFTPNTHYYFSYTGTATGYNIRAGQGGTLLSYCETNSCEFTTDSTGNVYFNGWGVVTPLTNVMISKNSSNYCEYGTTVSKLDEQKDAINNLDDTLKDDSVDENGVADAFESFNDYLDDNSTITQLITLPITLYTAILNNLNGTCQPFNLGKLYSEDLILPCINISQYLGNSLWTMIDIIISGFAVYAISKKMIKVFNNFSSLREGDVIDD